MSADAVAAAAAAGADENAVPNVPAPRLSLEDKIVRLGDRMLDLRAVRLRPFSRNRHSRALRRFSLTPREMQALTRLRDEREALLTRALAGEISHEEASVRGDEIAFRILEMTTYVPDPRPQRAPRFRAYHPCATLAGAKEMQGAFNFHIPDVFSDACIEAIAEEMLPEGSAVLGCGKLTPIEGVLLLLARFSHESTTYELLSSWFRRDAKDLCSHFNSMILELNDKFGSLLDPEVSVPKLMEKCGSEYERIVDDLLTRLRDGAPRINRINAFIFVLDGVRQAIARSLDSESQRSDYSGYTCNHNILRGILTALDGLIVALTKRHPGSTSDLAFQAEVAEVLREHGAPALADGVFSHIAGSLYPIPDRATREQLRITDDQCSAYAGVRITVEWTIGSLKNWFPYAFCAKKMSAASNRDSIFRAAALLYNALVLMRGMRGWIPSTTRAPGRRCAST